MIRTTMLLYSAITLKTSTLVTINMWNDGTSKSPRRGNYNWEIRGKTGRVLKHGHLDNWPRQAKTPCALLQRVINDAYPLA